MQRSVFNPNQVHVIFVVDKKLGQVFLRGLKVFHQLSFHQYSLFTLNQVPSTLHNVYNNSTAKYKVVQI